MNQPARALARHTSRPKREVTYEPEIYDQLCRWRDEDPDTGRRVVELMELAMVNPTKSRGRPKRLGGLPGVWSMRITKEHRLFYYANGTELRFLSCWGHDLPDELWDELHEGR